MRRMCQTAGPAVGCGSRAMGGYRSATVRAHHAPLPAGSGPGKRELIKKGQDTEAPCPSRHLHVPVNLLEATSGIEPEYTDLQSAA